MSNVYRRVPCRSDSGCKQSSPEPDSQSEDGCDSVKMALVIPTTLRQGWEECVDTFLITTTLLNTTTLVVDDTQAVGLLPKMELAYQHADTCVDILGYIHDDVVMREQGWDARVLREFDDPTVGVVGFGGALQHGSLDIYKTPYRLQQLGRSYYRSNVDDAETHGERFTGECDVAVLDGFALFVRRELLDKTGGWPLDKLQFHNYDYWVCCSARRHGYKIRLVGCRCHHLGGLTSTRPDYQAWCLETYGKTDAQVHEDSHRYIYEEFKDVLPWRVTD